MNLYWISSQNLTTNVFEPMNAKIEFKLKFLLNSLTLKVLEAKDLSDPKKVLSFNNRFCDSRKIQSFCTEMADISLFPMMGVPITLANKIHKVYLCEVAVGKSLFVSSEYANSLDVPTGYESFMVSTSDVRGFLSDAEVDVTTLAYIVKDSSRILPLYEVIFEYDDELERLSRKSFICHRCKRAQAIMFCPSERASFCKECDCQIHSDEFLKRHSRIYFSEVGQKKFICCSNHPTKIVEYFCETCMDPLCTDCKITGSHSSKDKYDHQIISFLEACQLLKTRMLECTQPIAGLVEGCGLEIERFKGKVSSFKDNIAGVRKQIEKEFKALLLQLDAIENTQRQIINAKYAERVINEESLKRTETYPLELDPADLLSEFKGIADVVQAGSQLVFDKFEPEKVELHGKISLVVPKESLTKFPASDTTEKSVRWRIETMHMTKEHESSVH